MCVQYTIELLDALVLRRTDPDEMYRKLDMMATGLVEQMRLSSKQVTPSLLTYCVLSALLVHSSPAVETLNQSTTRSQTIPIGVARWLSGRALDLRSSSRGFEAQPRRLGKLFTPYCLCHQAV